MSTQRIAQARHLAATGRARAIREAAHISLSEVARSLGTSKGNVSRWERAIAFPRGKVALAWLALLEDLEARH